MQKNDTLKYITITSPADSREASNGKEASKAVVQSRDVRNSTRNTEKLVAASAKQGCQQQH